MLRAAARVILAGLSTAILTAGLTGCAAAGGQLPFPLNASRVPAPASPSPLASPPESSASPVPSSPAQPPDAVAAPPPPSPAAVPQFDSATYSVDDAASIWVVADKLRPLHPTTYVPPDLVVPNVVHVANSQMRPAAAAAIAEMFAAAAVEGAGNMAIQNAYRSYQLQASIHDRLVASLGSGPADAQSARPGYSEHQTGLSADIITSPERCSIHACFGDTPQGVWLAANSWRFGFVLRYPADKVPITGYVYEPWHYRFVGPALAAELHTRGVSTLEEFFGLPAAPSYAG